MEENYITSLRCNRSFCHLWLILNSFSPFLSVPSDFKGKVKKRCRDGSRPVRPPLKAYALELVEAAFLTTLWAHGCLMGQNAVFIHGTLSLSLSVFLHGFQPNNAPAWLHHRLDMSPFLFVSFVTRRSACKAEYNILLSLSSQVSTVLFRRKRGHCTLNSDT